MDNEDVIAQEQANEIRHKMSQWRQANPLATLTEIEEAVEVELAQLRKQLVEEMVQQAARETSAVPDCPQCGQKMVKNGWRKRKLKGKEGQTVEIDRQQWRCLSCGTTLFPPG
jgi:transposase-like protein